MSLWWPEDCCVVEAKLILGNAWSRWCSRDVTSGSLKYSHAAKFTWMDDLCQAWVDFRQTILERLFLDLAVQFLSRKGLALGHCGFKKMDTHSLSALIHWPVFVLIFVEETFPTTLSFLEQNVQQVSTQWWNPQCDCNLLSSRNVFKNYIDITCMFRLFGRS